MMQYDFTNQSTEMSEFEIDDNTHSYPIYQQEQSNFKSTTLNSNMMTTNDIWTSSSLNSNTNYQSYDLNNSKPYHTTDNNYHFDYHSSTYHFVDPYSQIIPNDYPMDSCATPPIYNPTSINTSTDSYENHHSIYTNPSSSSSIDYQSNSTQWDLGKSPPPIYDIALTSNSSKQPCLVCHEESSGYHFGAYTCESCKAFYRRVTKDPNIELKHSCDIPLPNITKLNRKDCRACRKAKCEQVGMTILPKDRIIHPKSSSSSSSKPSILPIKNLLEQLAHDLTYNQLSTSTALDQLLHLLDLPLNIPHHIDYHSLYMNAIQIWRNQSNYSNIILNDIFAVLLFLFYSFIVVNDNHSNQSINNIQYDKLINILQQEINHITGFDHRLASKIKALFMKCYVTLAQYYPNNINVYNSNINDNSQALIPYQQYSVYNQ